MEFPQPRLGEVVSFLAFHEHGLGYPVHWLVCGLLNEWSLELQHFNPMGCFTSSALSPPARPSSGWSRTETSSGESSPGEPCRWGSCPGLCRLVAAQVGQFIKFDEMSETSTSHGGHTSVGSVPIEVPLSGLQLITMA